MSRWVAIAAVATGMLLAAALPAAAGQSSGGGSYSIEPLPWWRSRVVGGDRVIRLAILTGAADQIIPRAWVRPTPHTVRIGLKKSHYHGIVTGIGYLSCVEVHLRFEVEDRYRVDSNYGRAPDRAPRGSRVAAQREDTRSLNLKSGPCQRLRIKYLRPWTHDRRRGDD